SGGRRWRSDSSAARRRPAAGHFAARARDCRHWGGSAGVDRFGGVAVGVRWPQPLAARVGRGARSRLVALARAKRIRLAYRWLQSAFGLALGLEAFVGV